MKNATPKHITRNEDGKGLALFADDRGGIYADTEHGRVEIAPVPSRPDYRVTFTGDSFTSPVFCSINDAVDYAIRMYGEE